MEHNEKSTIFVTTVNGFQAVREDVDRTLAEIVSNTLPIILAWSLQAVILQVLCHLHGNCNWILILIKISDALQNFKSKAYITLMRFQNVLFSISFTGVTIPTWPPINCKS